MGCQDVQAIVPWGNFVEEIPMNSIAKSKEVPSDGLWPQVMSALSSVSMIKPSQGRVVRQVTFFGIAILFALLAWVIASFLPTTSMHYGVFGVLGVLGVWLSYRAINIPVFTDFLIGVEAEMRKVTWPTNNELYRGSVVVLFVVVSLSVLMFCFDVIWTAIFSWMRVR